MYNIRPYNQEDHSEAVKFMCKDVYDGLDFVPGRLRFYDSEEHCTPLVAECSAMKQVVCFINIREKKSEAQNDDEVVVFLEGLRVRKDMRRRGIAGMMISHAVEMVMGRYARKSISLSAAVDRNTISMKKIFERGRWERGELLFVWPSLKSIHDLEGDGTNMVQELAGEIFTDDYIERLDSRGWKFERVSSSTQIEEIMNTMGNMGAHSVRPHYFEVEERAAISKFLSAEGGNRSVWRIDHQQMVVAILFMDEQDEGVSVIGAVVKDAETAERALWFVANQLRFSRFQMVFDVAVGDANSLKARRVFGTREEMFFMYRLRKERG